MGSGNLGYTTAGTGTEIALFTFNNLTVDSGATITLSGSRAVGFLARNNLSFNSTLDISGAAASDASGGVGMLGGFSGANSSDPQGGGPGAGISSAGGGAGAALFVAQNRLTLGPSAKILATGGAGADPFAGGDGGSGGAVTLGAPDIVLQPEAMVNLGGGNGGSRLTPATKRDA